MMQRLIHSFIVLCLLFLFSGCSRTLHRAPAAVSGRGQPPLALAPATPVREPPLLIVIDAGHGGKDQGAQSREGPKSYEKNMALSTAFFLNDYLKGFGYHTLMTRSDDTFIPLKERSKFANEKKPLLFVSVHYNGAENSEANGIEVYYYENDKNPDRSKKSKLLAASVLDNIISNTQAKSRGVKHGNFSVIRETTMPAILVEGGFMTNAKEANKIRDAAYMKKIAWGIANGIRRYAATEKSMK